jgi:glucose/arabinose dehydrogenase
LLILVLILNSSLSFAEKSSPPNFQRSTQSPEGPKIIDSKLKVELVFEGVGFFSNMAFLGLDDILALDKNEGTVQRIVNETITSEPIFDAKVATKSERGMLGIAISSKYKTNEQVNSKQ